jgi:Tfp pilus assembly protein PilO
MAINNFTERERTLAFIALATLIFYFFFQFFLFPKWDEIAKLKSSARAQRLELKVAEQKVRILDALEKRLGSLPEKSMVPRGERSLQVLKNISLATTRSRLNLVSIQPIMGGETGGFQFNLSCTGRYKNLYDFLIALQRQRVMIFIDHLEIVRGGEEGLNIRITMTAY